MEVSENELNLDDNGCLLDLCEEKNINYPFFPKYGQYYTHYVRCVNDSSDMIPNFVGGSIPRSDRGDREYYCSTMLCLFKPWHSGICLKSKVQTWHEVFTNHTFTDRQIELMKYFNIQYECSNARDEFSKQHKQQSEEASGDLLWGDRDIYEDLDNMAALMANVNQGSASDQDGVMID